MDFGAFSRAAFYAVQDLDEGNFRTNYIRGAFTNSKKHIFT